MKRKLQWSGLIIEWIREKTAQSLKRKKKPKYQTWKALINPLWSIILLQLMNKLILMKWKLNFQRFLQWLTSLIFLGTGDGSEATSMNLYFIMLIFTSKSSISKSLMSIQEESMRSLLMERFIFFETCIWESLDFQESQIMIKTLSGKRWTSQHVFQSISLRLLILLLLEIRLTKSTAFECMWLYFLKSTQEITSQTMWSR